MGKIKEIIKKLKRNRPEESTKNRSPNGEPKKKKTKASNQKTHTVWVGPPKPPRETCA